MCFLAFIQTQLLRFSPSKLETFLLGEQRVSFSIAGKLRIVTKSFHFLLVKVMNVPQNSHQLVRNLMSCILGDETLHKTGEFYLSDHGLPTFNLRSQQSQNNVLEKNCYFLMSCVKPFALTNYQGKLSLVPNSNGPLLVGLSLDQCEEHGSQ